MTSMYKAINDLIIDTVGDFYPDESIFKNYYNDATLPKMNQFAVIQELPSIAHCATPYNSWDVDETTEMATNKSNQLVETTFQVEFYGNTNESIASSCANLFATALQCWYATDFLKQFGYTVGIADSPKNMSFDLDRDTYLSRYVIKFSLFNNQIFTKDIESFDQVKFNIVEEK